MRLLRLALPTALLFLTGCGLIEDTKEDLVKAEALIEDFQAHYNAQSFDPLYEKLLHPKWHDLLSPTELASFLKNIQTRAGRRISGKQTHYKWSPAMLGDATGTVTYETNFKKGAAVEIFTFMSLNGNPKLIGYSYQSMNSAEFDQTSELSYTKMLFCDQVPAMCDLIGSVAIE